MGPCRVLRDVSLLRRRHCDPIVPRLLFVSNLWAVHVLWPDCQEQRLPDSPDSPRDEQWGHSLFKGPEGLALQQK